MPVRLPSLVVVGPAGSGRSTALREWVADTDRTRRVEPRLIEATLTPVGAGALVEWHTATDPDVALAIDDVDRLDANTLGAVAGIAAERLVSVSTSSAATSPALDRLIERLVDGTTAADPADMTRLAALDANDIAERFDVDEQTAATLARVTGGCLALVGASVRSDWTGDLDEVGADLADAALRRVRAQPTEVGDVVRLHVVGVSPLAATRIVGRRSDHDVDRLLASSGLAVEDAGLVIVPLVSTVVAADMNASDRSRLADVVITDLTDDAPGSREALDALAPADIARLHLASSIATPTQRAAAATRLGTREAPAMIASLPDAASPDIAALAFADDLRHLRLERAVTRPVPATQPWPAVIGVALSMTGLASAAPAADDQSIASDIWRTVDESLSAFADGEVDHAITLALRVHDDARRADDLAVTGITPSAVMAMLLLQAGSGGHAHDVAADAAALQLGGPGEQRTHALLAGIAGVRRGDFSVALDLVRGADRASLRNELGRDAVLCAALNAAIARRSGDTARLRDAWQLARPLLDRGLETWLLTDQLVDLAAAGARVGDGEPGDRLLARLDAQLDRLPSGGPAATMRMWAELQVDLAAERWDLVASVPGRAASVDERTLGSDVRSTARVLARRAWAEVASSRLGGQAVATSAAQGAATAMQATGDVWDASRLLGQAALDETDPKRARELLEAARGLVSEPVETTDRLVAAGLSEREAEVSRLVADGHTYKEIGGQLYISPKTVEHHVAKIRQRLGAGSRAELLAAIRELTG